MPLLRLSLCAAQGKNLWLLFLFEASRYASVSLSTAVLLSSLRLLRGIKILSSILISRVSSSNIVCPIFLSCLSTSSLETALLSAVSHVGPSIVMAMFPNDNDIVTGLFFLIVTIPLIFILGFASTKVLCIYSSYCFFSPRSFEILVLSAIISLPLCLI